MNEADPARRFGGIERLYGKAALAAFTGAHVAVIGIGGVGSWAAEALARSAIGAITLIDLDMIAESNVNRQIHALGDMFGRAKVDVMAGRIRDINPNCDVRRIEDFLTPDNADEMLSPGFDWVIDAIDDTRAKVALIAACVARNIPIITAGAAGGRIDPTQVRTDDLSQTIQDNLLARVRQGLRKEHGFPREAKKKFGVTAVFSIEPMRREEGVSCAPASGGLNCSGYGSAVSVTGTFGFAATAAVLRGLAMRDSTTHLS